MSSTLILLLHGILSRGGVYWVVHPQRPRDIPRAEPDGLLSGLGGCISQYIPPLCNVWVLLYIYYCTSPEAQEKSLGLRPRVISRASGNLLAVYYCILLYSNYWEEHPAQIAHILLERSLAWIQAGPRLYPGWTQVGHKLDPSWTQLGPKCDPGPDISTVHLASSHRHHHQHQSFGRNLSQKLRYV